MRYLAIVAVVLASSAPSSAQCAFHVDPPASVRRLVSLLRDRLLTAEDVAKAKHNSGAPVEDGKREAAVVRAAIKYGETLKIPAWRTGMLFEAQIKANKMVQRAFLAEWAGRPKLSSAPDLARDVRPKLDALTHEILKACATALPVLSAPGADSKVVAASDAIRFDGPNGARYRGAWQEAIRGALKGP